MAAVDDAADIQSDYSYSDDTFESAPDEHPSEYLYLSFRRESICLAESSESSSIDESVAPSVSCQNVLNEVEEYSVEFDSEEESNSQTEYTTEFVKKKLDVLSSKRSYDGGECITEPNNVGSKSSCQSEKTSCLESLSFCDAKITQLQKHSSGNGNQIHPQARHARTECSNERKAGVVFLGNTTKIESLKTENLLSKMAKATSGVQHNPSSCKSCRKQKSKLAEVDFLKRKLEALRRPAFEARLENHLYGRDGATLLAEIINSGPKPSDPPGEIWDRLLKQKNTENRQEPPSLTK